MNNRGGMLIPSLPKNTLRQKFAAVSPSHYLIRHKRRIQLGDRGGKKDLLRRMTREAQKLHDAMKL
jgi:hypothetical protein